jgi:2'-5' RNA ligase
MRLFVAIDLSDDVRDAVVAEQERLRHVLGSAPLAWVRPEQLHLTLVFLGEVDPTRVAALIDQFSAPLAEISPFELRFAGVGMFPEARAPRVLWLGVHTGSREAIELHRHVARRVSAAGLPLESRPYHPHLTVARWPANRPRLKTGRYTRDQRLADLDGGPETVRPTAPMLVEAVTLYQSRLSSSGATHVAVAGASLCAPGRRS